ncbi:recombinase [Erwinia phage vB_EhrS_59]|uniref:Uncharacterized protein n=1 Tax=Erwinia phage vB_EhrS_59 TaxID=2283025 RepID=A0A4Y1NRX1_9CAUD|nr:recombinase [Erwinia phage vB_EhrS_59]AXH43561.1 hypothetical protein MZUP2_430 [Erwinia phage vB_EhrS_59]
MSPAKTIEESITRRRSHLIDALHYRRNGLRKAKQAALNCALCEKLNQKYFLGKLPF